jgi:excisionase family DNA binding protein
MALPRYITLSEAASRLGTSLAELNRLIKNGTLKAAQVAGEIVVSEPSIYQHKTGKKVQPISMGNPTGKKKENLPEYQQFSHLAGVEIWVREAARKYDIRQSTLSKWIKGNYIRQIGTDRNRILLDEQDIAYCVFVYRRAKELGYQWMFYSDGTPYAPRPEKLESKAEQSEFHSPAS